MTLFILTWKQFWVVFSRDSTSWSIVSIMCGIVKLACYCLLVGEVALKRNSSGVRLIDINFLAALVS
eukprot:5815731-Amphidinium_carterae.1